MEKEPVYCDDKKERKKQTTDTPLIVPFTFLGLLGPQFTTFLQRQRFGLGLSVSLKQWSGQHS